MTLHYYRSMDGKRVRYRMELDHTLLVLSDHPVESPKSTALAPASSPQAAELARRGIQYEIKDGRVLLLSVPEREKTIMQFFAPSIPCFFPGCEALRKAYNAELAVLESDDCTDCDRGKLMTRYRRQVELMLDTNAKTLPHSGSGEAS